MKIYYTHTDKNYAYGAMATTRKARLNLYINRQLLDFAKKWSYVTDVPISGMLEELLREQQERVRGISPFQWLNDQGGAESATTVDAAGADLKDYLDNPEEEEFCRLNPDHPRAKMRRKLLVEYEQSSGREMEEQKTREREFISRWLKVFPVR